MAGKVILVKWDMLVIVITDPVGSIHPVTKSDDSGRLQFSVWLKASEKPRRVFYCDCDEEDNAAFQT